MEPWIDVPTLHLVATLRLAADELRSMAVQIPGPSLEQEIEPLARRLEEIATAGQIKASAHDGATALLVVVAAVVGGLAGLIAGLVL